MKSRILESSRNSTVLEVTIGESEPILIEPYLIKPLYNDFIVGANLYISEDNKSDDEKLIPSARPYCFLLSNCKFSETSVKFKYHRVLADYIFSAIENYEKQLSATLIK